MHGTFPDGNHRGVLNQYRKGIVDMLKPSFLTPLEHLSYVIECSCIGCYGDTKGELSNLCDCIRNKSEGYEGSEFKDSLQTLEKALASYRESNYKNGASLLSRVSRAWWKATMKRCWISFDVFEQV